MNTMCNASDIRVEWNYMAVLIAFLFALLLQFILLPCLCYEGTVKMQIAGVVDAMVLVRLLLARIRRERGRGWIFYAILPFLIIPMIELAVRLWPLH